MSIKSLINKINNFIIFILFVSNLNNNELEPCFFLEKVTKNSYKEKKSFN